MERERGFEIVADKFRKNKIDVVMPKRMTKKSAGYDFFLPYDITIEPKKSILIWTDIKVFMKDDELFKIFPRSSTAIKKNIRIKNIVGIIDADYYNNPSNDGNIGINLYNFGNKSVTIKAGEGIAQGIFQKFLTAYNCNSDEKRVGGTGSTNK